MTETPQQERLNTEHLRDYSELRRSTTDRKVAGVAGGLGRHLNVDPTILRVVFVVLAFFGGAGLLLYGALWLFVPTEGSDEAVVSTSAATRNGVIVVAAVLAGLLLVGDSWGGFGFPWPLLVIGLVLFLVLTNRDKAMSPDNTPYQHGAAGGGGMPPSGTAEETPSGTPEETRVYGTGPYDTYGDVGHDAGGPTTETPSAPYSGTVPPATSPYPVQQPPAPRPDRGPKLFWFTVALLAVALGALGLYDVAQGSVVDAAYPALALAVIGTMLVVGAWFGRPGGLTLLGVVAAIALVATSVTQPRFVGDRTLRETPTRAVQVEDRYFVPAGRIYLDMSNIRDVDRLDGRSVDVEANAGDLVVVLPEGVDAQVDAHVAGAGEIRFPGEDRGGVGGISLDRTIDGGADAPQIDLNLDLVVGSIEVRQ